MSKLSLVLLLAIVGCRADILTGVNKKDWKYIIHSFASNSTNDNIISANLRPIRVVRGVYGLNGTVNIGSEIDDEYKVEITILRSSSGTSQYKLTPFKVPRCSFYFFMNRIYKKFAMEDLKNCSDFPIFEKFDSPVPVKLYHMNNCIVRTDAMPSHMQPGYYRIIFEVIGPLVHFVSDLTSQIFQD